MMRLREANRGGKTFDVLGKVPSNHLIQQFGYALDDWRLEDITRVSADSGLVKKT